MNLYLVQNLNKLTNVNEVETFTLVAGSVKEASSYVEEIMPNHKVMFVTGLSDFAELDKGQILSKVYYNPNNEYSNLPE